MKGRASKYQTLKAEGKCACGKYLVPGRARCSRCLETDRARFRRKYPRQLARKHLGLCVICSQPNERIPGSPYCGYHRELKTDSVAKLRKERRDRGECPECGEAKASDRFVYCQVCRDLFASWKRAQRARVAA